MKEGYIGIPSIFLYKKYAQIFARLLNNLKMKFYENNYQKEEKYTCTNCGIQIVDKNQKFCEICGWEIKKI
jgi:rRNA maturation endonuclease Nob1